MSILVTGGARYIGSHMVHPIQLGNTQKRRACHGRDGDDALVLA